jgi:hypothetical protein
MFVGESFLLCCSAALLLCCSAALLLCCSAALLLCCSAALLLCCSAALVLRPCLAGGTAAPRYLYAWIVYRCSVFGANSVQRKSCQFVFAGGCTALRLGGSGTVGRPARTCSGRPATTAGGRGGFARVPGVPLCRAKLGWFCAAPRSGGPVICVRTTAGGGQKSLSSRSFP